MQVNNNLAARIDTLTIEFINGIVSNYWTEEVRH